MDKNLPPKARPTLMTYGKGIREVKLKHIVSSIRRSTASSLWRSSSTVCKSMHRQHVTDTRQS